MSAIDGTNEDTQAETPALRETRVSTENESRSIADCIVRLERLLGRARSSTGNEMLDRIIAEAGLRTRAPPSLFRLRRYLAVRTLEQKLGLERRRLRRKFRDIDDLERKEKAASTCPDCGGLGEKRVVRYARDDGLVHSILEVGTCPSCGGSGKATTRNYRGRDDRTPSPISTSQNVAN